MKHSPVVILAALFLSTSALAADPLPGQAVTPAKAIVTAQAAKTQAAPSDAKLSQQDKMRSCSKQATGKKGAERKAFMKSCLSKKS